MKRNLSLRERQVGTLERLYELELEHARVEHTALERAVAEQGEQVLKLKDQIGMTLDEERSLMLRSEGASPETLRRLRTFTIWQLDVLAQQQERLVQTQSAASEARARLVARFQRLAVIRKLRERWARNAHLMYTRRELKSLDDLAVTTTHQRRQEPTMAVDAIGLPASSNALSVPPTISENDFLQILLTQLQFQDPLKPVDNEQFVAQLAQFSALEVAQEQNTKLGTSLTMQDVNQAVALLGRHVATSGAANSTSGLVSAITFSTSGQPMLTITPSGTGATTVNVNLSDITLVQQ